MDEKEQLQDHEQRIKKVEGKAKNADERIRRLEEGQSEIYKKIDDLTEQIKIGNVRSEKDSKFLQNQVTHVTDLLAGVREKQETVHVVTWQTTGKVAMAVSAVVGLVTVVINLIFH